VRLLSRRQVRSRSTSHAAPKKNNVTFFDANDLRQVVVYRVRILLHHLLVRLAGLVESVARVLDGEHVHLHLSAEHVEQVEGKADVFRISVEVDHNFVATLFARKEQAWDVLQRFVLLLLLINDTASR